jgi:carbon-monoxide dehydrogenase small subunit
MLISATALLANDPDPGEDEIRIALSGNLCRCTGYDGIVKAVRAVAEGRDESLPIHASPHTDHTPPHHAG